MSKTAHDYTEEQLAALEEKIARVYKEAADEIGKIARDYFEKFAKRDAEQLKLVEAGQITKDEYNQWRLTQMARGERYRDLQNKLAERCTNANELAVEYVNGEIPDVYALNRNYAAYLIEQAGESVDFNLWDEATVRRNLVEDPNLMPYYPEEKALQRGIDLAYGREQITANITSGILQGLSPYQIADNLQAHLENMNRVSAIRTARTAFTSAENAGTQDTFEEAADMGIPLDKEWIATLDARTRADHLAADGQVVPYDEPFEVGGDKLMYPGDPSGSPAEIYGCRCTMIARIRGVDISDRQRRGSGEPFEDWLADKRTEELGVLQPKEAADRLQEFADRMVEENPDITKTEMINAWFDELRYRDQAEVVPESVFDSIQSDYPTLYRGVETEEYKDQFVNGELYLSRGGFAGTGINTTSDPEDAPVYGGEFVIEMKLSSDAKVITDGELLMVYGEARDQLQNGSREAKWLADPGCVASAMGYDAIDDAAAGWYNVLNRSELIINEGSI